MSNQATPVGASPESLAAAMDHCRNVCRNRARNFYYGLKISPEPQRSALYVLYAWMRQADDLVDDPQIASDGSHERVRAFRDATDAALGGRPLRGDPLWLALAAVAAQFDLSPVHFHHMLDGQIDDLSHRDYQTFEDLHEYCHRVASTVGLLCIQIWGYSKPNAIELAANRGIAFQLTNILRDYKQDFDAGRTYLPREDFDRFNLTPADLRHWSIPAACQAMMEHQINRARSYYERSVGLEDLISPSCRPTLWAMTSIYRSLLRKIEQQPKRIVLARRVRLSAMHKAAIALRARWAAHSARRDAMLPELEPARISSLPTKQTVQ